MQYGTVQSVQYHNRKQYKRANNESQEPSKISKQAGQGAYEVTTDGRTIGWYMMTSRVARSEELQ